MVHCFECNKACIELTHSFVIVLFQELLHEIEGLETPYQEIISASQYVLSYLNGTLQNSASQIIEKKLDDLKEQYAR